MNSFLQVCDVFSFVFWKKLKTPKRHFEIISPLVSIKLTTKSLSISVAFLENMNFTPLAVQIVQAANFMLSNVAYKPTVYKTGIHALNVNVNNMSSYPPLGKIATISSFIFRLSSLSLCHPRLRLRSIAETNSHWDEWDLIQSQHPAAI